MWCPAIRVNLTKRKIQLHPINQTITSLSTKTEKKIAQKIKIHTNVCCIYSDSTNQSQAVNTKPPSEWTVEEVAGWLEMNPKLARYATAFHEQRMDGENMAMLCGTETSLNDAKTWLQELGVKSIGDTMTLLKEAKKTFGEK